MEIWGIPWDDTDICQQPCSRFLDRELTSCLIVENSSEMLFIWENIRLVREIRSA